MICDRVEIGLESGQHGERRRRRPGQPGGGSPAGREQPTGREQQGGKYQRQGKGRIPRPGGIPSGKDRARQRPGPGHQSVGGILGCQRPGDRQQPDGREDPADGVAGSMGHDQGPDDHEGSKARHQHDEAGGILLEGAVGDREEVVKTMVTTKTANIDKATQVQRLRTAEPRTLPAVGTHDPRDGKRCTARPSRDRYEVRTHDVSACLRRALGDAWRMSQGTTTDTSSPQRSLPIRVMTRTKDVTSVA